MNTGARAWSSVTSELLKLTATTTEEQVNLALMVHFELPREVPRLVAAALLRPYLCESLAFPIRPYEPTDRRQDYVQNLARDVNVMITTALDTVELIDAWIKYLYYVKDLRALQDLQPNIGDIVSVKKNGIEDLAEISSISGTGRLNLKGGLGWAWPHTVKMISRTFSSDYQDLQYRARQSAANRRRPSDPGTEVLRELEKWKVRRSTSMAGITAFAEALDSALDERPLQAVLQEHPEILAHIVSWNEAAYVRPQVQFSTNYVADFMLAGINSLGLLWTYVELESPIAPLALKNGGEPKEMRKGLDQIRSWKEYVEENADSARKLKVDGGMSLHGIRAGDPGLLLIGRGSLTFDIDKRRRYIAEKENIAIRTYDWLLREVSRPRRLGFGVLEIEANE